MESTATTSPPPASVTGDTALVAGRAGAGRAIGYGVAIALLVFLAVAPTLTWLEFSSGSENLNIATVLEMEREGHWLIPQLQGEPRTRKPPLTAWLTALPVSASARADLTSPDPLTRARAERALAWQTRSIALASACAMLLAVYALALAIGDVPLAVMSALVCGSSLLFLRHARFATTDGQLALWVNVASAALAWAIVRGRWWWGFIIAGIALGLANMSKGPVALVQSALPVALFAVWRRGEGDGAGGNSTASPVAAAGVGIVLMLLVGYAWFAWVLTRSGGGLWSQWVAEVTREGATDLPASRWYNYLSMLVLVFPWTAFLVVGLIVIVQRALARTRSAAGVNAVLPLLLVVVPIVIMSFAKDRKERYLLPMIGPAAVIVAYGLREHLASWSRWNRADTLATALHWLPLAIVAIGLPLAGAFGAAGLMTVEHQPWYSLPFGITLAAGMAGLLIAGVAVHRRWRGGLVATTVLVMLILQAVLIHGYRNAREGRSEMKPLAEAIGAAVPDAIVFNGQRDKRVPSDLSIYLDRTIRSVDDPSALQAGDRPLVLVVYQSKRDPAPALPGEQWRKLAKVRRDDNWWHAFLLPPRQGEAGT